MSALEGQCEVLRVSIRSLREKHHLGDGDVVHLSPERFGFLKPYLKRLNNRDVPWPDYLTLSFSSPPFHVEGLWIIADPGLCDNEALVLVRLGMDKKD